MLVCGQRGIHPRSQTLLKPAKHSQNWKNYSRQKPPKTKKRLPTPSNATNSCNPPKQKSPKHQSYSNPSPNQPLTTQLTPPNLQLYCKSKPPTPQIPLILKIPIQLARLSKGLKKSLPSSAAINRKKTQMLKEMRCRRKHKPKPQGEIFCYGNARDRILEHYVKYKRKLSSLRLRHALS